MSGRGHNVGSTEFCCGEKKTQPGSDLNIKNETQTREETERRAGRGKGRRGCDLPQRSRVERVKGVELFSHVAALQLSASQPAGGTKKERRDGEGGNQTRVQRRSRCKLYSNKAVKVNTSSQTVELCDDASVDSLQSEHSVDIHSLYCSLDTMQRERVSCHWIQFSRVGTIRRDDGSEEDRTQV